MLHPHTRHTAIARKPANNSTVVLASTSQSQHSGVGTRQYTGEQRLIFICCSNVGNKKQECVRINMCVILIFSHIFA